MAHIVLWTVIQLGFVATEQGFSSVPVLML